MMASEPRAYTTKEVRTMLLDHMRAHVDYWDGVKSDTHPTQRDRMMGLLHSFLCIFDGVSGNIPAFDIVCRPHPDDQKCREDDGENWYPDGETINGDCHLHDLLYPTPDHRPPHGPTDDEEKP